MGHMSCKCEEKVMKKRVLYLDVLRIAACFGVIANHTNFILKRAETAIASVSRTDFCLGLLAMVLCKTAVTLFLMISGALLLRKIDDYRKSIGRIIRIIVVLTAFSAIYYIVGDYQHSLIDFVRTVTKNNVTTAFWYLYLYLGILIMLPTLQRMTANLKMADYIYFFIFSLVICSFSFVTEYNSHISLPLYTTYVGVFVLGYFLDSVLDLSKFKTSIVIIVCVGVGVMLTGFLFIYTYYRVMTASANAYHLIVYDNVFYTALAACEFVFVKKIIEIFESGRKFKNQDNISQMISYIGNCTFGIYLFSDFFIKYIEPVFEGFANDAPNAPLFILMLGLDLIVFLVGLVATVLLKQIPVIKKLL
jgi:surface polysaccharide O-acyltransferase-like enzyme